jgi:hypothetical protein
MEYLQMMKYSIRKGRPLNFTQGMCWNDELLEVEFAARVEPVGDAEAYGRSLKDAENDSDAIEDEMDEMEKVLQAIEEESEEIDLDNDSDSASDDE